MKFKEAISKKALLDYGNLGKLIKQGYIVLPEQPDKETHGLDDDQDGLNKLDYLEDMKAYLKELADYRRDMPKLYALILQYLSDESLDAVQKEVGWAVVEQDANPEALWQLVEKKHKVHSASEVETAVKLAARTQLVTTRQGAFETIIAFKQIYTNALKAYKDQKNPVKSLQDEAMDFFSKLDTARYLEFKTNYINSLQLKSCKPPADLNEIFTLANTYLKPKVATGYGLGSTFATTADYISKKERQKRPKKQIKCFNCEGDNYVSNCPELLALRKAKVEGKLTAATWEGSTFCTYQVNTVGVEGFGPTKVLLDNQADISIMKPDLLRMLEVTEKPIRVNGVGGVQLVVSETGYLQDFFRVYATKDTKANVLCFMDVEDLYKITYKQGTSFTVHLPDRDIMFKRRNKLYVANFVEYYGNVLATKAYTKGEIHWAALAYDFLKMSRYPSI
jgi:hypothetical protein